jgi:hypothetical protein
MGIADDGLRKIVQHHMPKATGWLWTPIETGATHAGVPDSFWAHEETKTHGWVEHKATGGWAVTVRPHQVAWMELYARAGVHCVFMIRAHGAGSAEGQGDALWVVAGSAARQLAEGGLENLPRPLVLGYWPGPPAEWDWRIVKRILTHPVY